MCYYVTQIWKGRKIPKQHLKEKHHKNHAKGTRIFFCFFVFFANVHGYH